MYTHVHECSTFSVPLYPLHHVPVRRTVSTGFCIRVQTHFIFDLTLQAQCIPEAIRLVISSASARMARSRMPLGYSRFSEPSTRPTFTEGGREGITMCGRAGQHCENPARTP